MKAELTMSNLYWVRSLMQHFFRTQAEETLISLLKELDEEIEEFDYGTLFNAVDELYENVDDAEEDFYSMSVDELREKLNF